MREAMKDWLWDLLENVQHPKELRLVLYCLCVLSVCLGANAL